MCGISFLRSNVQAAFFRTGLFPPPASVAEILSGLDRAGAWRTPDARVSAIVELVVGNVELLHIGPRVIESPVQQRTEFVEAIGLVPFLNLQGLAGIRLFAA